MAKSSINGLSTRNIFHISGFILNNCLIYMENGCLKTQTYHQNLEVSAPKQNLLNEIQNNSQFLQEDSLQEGVVQLINNESSYFITSNSDPNDKHGFFLFFKTKDGQIAARHFNVINNRAIKNVHLFLFRSINDFIKHTIQTELKYGFKVSLPEKFRATAYLPNKAVA